MSTIRRPQRRRSNPTSMMSKLSNQRNAFNARRKQNRRLNQSNLAQVRKLQGQGMTLQQIAKLQGKDTNKVGGQAKLGTKQPLDKPSGAPIYSVAEKRARASARKKTTSTRRTRSPGLTRVVDPMPNSPERQRRKNRKPVMDPPKGAGKRPTRRVRPKRDNKTVTPVRRARRKPSERFNRGF